jgi:hypothetical protein
VDRRKRLSGNMTRLGEKINAYRVLVRKVQGKRPLGIDGRIILKCFLIK